MSCSTELPYLSSNAPSLIIAPPTFAKFIFQGFTSSQQPAPLRIRDSEKRCVFVLAQLITAYGK